MRSRIGLVCSKRVPERGLKYAFAVGVILVAINHGEAIMNGELAIRVRGVS